MASAPAEISWWGFVLAVVAALLLVSILWAAKAVIDWVWLRPRRLERALRSQGLRGSPYRFLYGDLKENARLNKEAQSMPMAIPSHHIVPRVLPLFHHSIKEYGKISITWLGPSPQVTITNPDLIREVLSNKFGHFRKPRISPLGRFLVSGVAVYEGEQWARHRKIINPAFHVEKLKRMLPAFAACCNEMVSKWEDWVAAAAAAKGSTEIDVWPELQSLTGDVISRTAFGSNYREGTRIFQLQSEQAELVMQAAQAVYIPGYRFLPTKKNKRRKEIDQVVRSLLRNIIEKREKAIKMHETSEDDLLGLMMESNNMHYKEYGNKSYGMTTEEVIEECKLFYFAGQETTSVLLTWTMIILSMHQTWQVRAREEVLQVFGERKPDFDGLSRLKIVTMILYEVLRLYPPVTFLRRRVYKTMKLGTVTYPPGVLLVLPLIIIHHDPQFWGSDATEFNPERFAEGISKASKDQLVFFPFGWGPRICIGQNFALLEAKMALSMILQRFSFELSPSYVHAPRPIVTLQPKYGAQIMLHRL